MSRHNGKFIAYYRVSTVKQGASGLGIEAQKEAVKSYLNGGHWDLIEELTETESGKNKDRPVLAAALNDCRVYGATLIIAKLDRLARNVHFISEMMESNVDFVACDFPKANRLTLHVLAAVAEHEAKMISERTKAALAVRREQLAREGKRLGKQDSDFIKAFAPKAGARSGEVRRLKAEKRAKEMRHIIATIRARGATSTRAIAQELNWRQVPTPRGGQWSASQVWRMLRHAEAAA